MKFSGRIIVIALFGIIASSTTMAYAPGNGPVIEAREAKNKVKSGGGSDDVVG